MNRERLKRVAIWTLAGMVVVFAGATVFFVLQERKPPVGPGRDVYAQSQTVEEYSLNSQAHDIDSVKQKSEVGDELLLRGLPDGAAASEPQGYRGHNTGGYGMGTSLAKLDIPSFDERVIRTAGLELQVTKGRFDERYDRAVAIARGAGGYVSQSKSNATGTSIASGELVMRIRSHNFDQVLTALKKLGKIKALDVSSEDVSEEFVDLNSRLKHWRAQEAVMLELMTKAKTIADSIAIQNNLSQIQMEIERISGRLNYLEDRTSYATIRLYMAEPQVVPVKDTLGLKAALRDALRASAKTFGAFLMLAGYLLPLAIIMSAGYASYRVLRK
jgi:hypothetical protein